MFNRRTLWGKNNRFLRIYEYGFLWIFFFYWIALAQLTERLTERGFKVFVVPEVPTITMEGGGMIMMANLSADKITKFQVF